MSCGHSGVPWHIGRGGRITRVSRILTGFLVAVAKNSSILSVLSDAKQKRSPHVTAVRPKNRGVAHTSGVVGESRGICSASQRSDSVIAKIRSSDQVQVLLQPNLTYRAHNLLITTIPSTLQSWARRTEGCRHITAQPQPCFFAVTGVYRSRNFTCAVRLEVRVETVACRTLSAKSELS